MFLKFQIFKKYLNINYFVIPIMKIGITGISGVIGSVLYQGLKNKYEIIGFDLILYRILLGKRFELDLA